MANFAEFEGRWISTRTGAALAAAMARGVKLGTAGSSNLLPNIEARNQAADVFAKRLSGLVVGSQARGLSQRGRVSELNTAGVLTPKRRPPVEAVATAAVANSTRCLTAYSAVQRKL